MGGGVGGVVRGGCSVFGRVVRVGTERGRRLRGGGAVLSEVGEDSLCLLRLGIDYGFLCCQLTW
jgi:hypothetical protein